MAQNTVSVVIGAQWGDEGKGKLVDILSRDVDLVCRCQGGSNAGHTVVINSTSYFFHLIPSGITNRDAQVIIGNGVVVHLPTLMKEIENNTSKGLTDMEKRLYISNRAHLVFDMHQAVDGFLESARGKKSLGTTKRGIGPCYSTKALRNGLRVCDLDGDFTTFSEKFRNLVQFQKQMCPSLEVDVDDELQKYKELAKRIHPMVIDSVSTLNSAIRDGKRILVEGANATMLDVDFGTYPYVTSSNCTAGGVCTGLGIPPRHIGQVCGVVKAYTTRVGAGTLPTELLDDLGSKMQKIGQEFGTTTGRPRRCGWLDLVVVMYSHMLNGFSSLAITKLDVLDDFEEIKIGIAYLHHGKRLPTFPADMEILAQVEVEYITLPGWKTSIKDIRKFNDLPLNAQNYIKKIEEIAQIPSEKPAVHPNVNQRNGVSNLFSSSRRRFPKAVLKAVTAAVEGKPTPSLSQKLLCLYV